MAKLKQLIIERKHVENQHKSPCSDCPWARKSLRGWLGGFTKESWVQAAHSDAVIPCHTRDKQCAGAAIFRANVCKSPRDPEALRLPSDEVRVFAEDKEFFEHHMRPEIRRR